jgi:stage II sporulation SpoE-like protein/FHA domain-containing protein
MPQLPVRDPVGERVAKNPRLRVQLKTGELLQHDLVARRTTIGRSLASDVVIPDSSISRQHAVIVRQGRIYVIEDASSRNGVIVNGTRIGGAVPLSARDEIVLGACRITFDWLDDLDRDDEDTGSTTQTGAFTLPARFTPSPRDGFGGTAPSKAASEPSGHAGRGTVPPEIVRQLNVARSIQKLLLPNTSPPIAGYRIFGDSQPCYAVGGDFFDFFPLPNARVGIVLGDVSGKGLGAALLAHFTQATIRTALKYESRLERVLPGVNEDICERSLENQFVTLCVCVLDPASGDLHYVNAGHCPPLLVSRGGETQFLDDSSPVLGVSKHFTFDVQHVNLDYGSAIVLYSDGFTECSNSHSTEFGGDRLAQFFAPRAASPPEQIVRELEVHLERFGIGNCQADDMTLVLLQRD